MQCGPFTVVSLMSTAIGRPSWAWSPGASPSRSSRRRRSSSKPQEEPREIDLAAVALSVAALCRRLPHRKTDSRADVVGRQDITVFAAASLKSTFTELGAQFEKDNPGTTVTFNFAGSSDLVAQLDPGRARRCVRLRRHQQHDQGRRRGRRVAASRSTSPPTR